MSRIMVADVKMKYFRIRGRGDSMSDILTIANVHMSARTAKKDLKGAAVAYKSFWDELATRLVQYGPRLLIGDFNMSLWCVVVELRARGFQINLAVWYPFYMDLQEEMRVGSVVIFCIGPWQGVRLIYGCSLLEIPAPPRGDGDSMVMEEIKDDAGKVIDRRPYECHIYTIPDGKAVQGYVIESYLPKSIPGRNQYVKWNFEVSADKGEDSAVAELKRQWRKNQTCFKTCGAENM